AALSRWIERCVARCQLSRLRRHTYHRARSARSTNLKSTELAEPAQRQLHLGSLQLVDTDEMFQPHSLESGARHRRLGLTFEGRRRDNVVHAPADPDGDVKEIAARL